MELRESSARGEERTEGAREVKDTTRKPTESTNLVHPQESIQETELGPLGICTCVQLGLHAVPLAAGAEAVSDSVACFGILYQ